MIIASLSDSARYEMLNPLFRRAFDFIREAAPAALETGRHVLEEDALTVMVNEAVMKKRENARMEVHDRFIDIHVPLSREEGFMWKERAALEKPSEPFSREKDAQHYDDAPDTSFVVRPGQFAIFFPEDAHAGCIGDGKILKLVIKVRTASTSFRQTSPEWRTGRFFNLRAGVALFSVFLPGVL